MRILHIPDQPSAEPAVAAPPPVFDTERVAALERFIRSLQEKIRDLEERLRSLETAPQQEAPIAPPMRPRMPIAEVTWDADSVKKNLLARMWKYLNDDDRPAKAV